MECPHIDRNIRPDPRFNLKKVYKARHDSGGKPCADYVYWLHDDGCGAQYPCQFCQLIGRKRDIFECFNEYEWKRCGRYVLIEKISETARTET